jgi:hypothetical protein
VFESQPAADARNHDIDVRNRLGVALIGGSVAAGVASAILFWRAAKVDAGASAGWTIAPGPAPLGLDVAGNF